MYKISVIDRKGEVSKALAASPLWAERQDFEYVGDTAEEDKAIEFLKITQTSMVFINADDRDSCDIPLINDIKTILPDVYIVLASHNEGFKSVHNGFISGIFDYMLLPSDDNTLKEILLRLYSDLGNKYIYKELTGAINSLIESVFNGKESIVSRCQAIIETIYSYFEKDELTSFIVTEKAKSFIYDEILRKAPWLKNFTFKYNFIHKTGAQPESKPVLIKKWSEDFQSIADTISKYRILDNNLINDIGFYIINNVDEHLTLDDVSKGVFLNKSYISHIFKKISGISFINFITHVKVDRAKILLMDPHLKIYEIAAQIGYNNPEYFSRVFKSVTGLTPNRYRAGLNIDTE